MKIALAQMKMDSDRERNYRQSLQLIKDASDCGAELICFPEIQLTPFFPQYEGKNGEAFCIRLDSPYIQGICALCKEKGIFASPNFYIEEHGKRYDMSLLIDDEGRIVGKQKMVHVAQCEKFYEQSYYTPSEEGFGVFDTKLGRIGIVVCFDRHYPESIRTEALRGAELILIPTANTTAEPSELFQWEVKIQAFQNSVNIAMCNRVGREDDMEFAGESIVADYNGDTLALAGGGEELLFARIDMEAAADIRKSKPYTELRRRELYE
ncbi:MAG: carbon-nitrogen hydrolase family protein [Lachnospiraceae bacterium]|nr:carbon-nitrogen hydrolase family protein [Lachnospiraceae bacterium]